MGLEEARCVNDDDDLIYSIDDIANENNEDLNTDTSYVDFHENNSRKDVAVKSNNMAPML